MLLSPYNINQRLNNIYIQILNPISMILEILEILLLFVLPVVLIYYRIISFRYRIHSLIIVAIIAFLIILFKQWSLDKLGISLNTPMIYLAPYAIFTLFSAILLIIISKLLKRRTQPNFFSKKHFIYGFIMVSIFQEFLFRGYLFPVLQQIFPKASLIILVNAILFTSIHSIYSNDTISLVMIFLGGIFFASIYSIYPNLILITISHAILNFIVVLYGFYYEEKTSIAITKYYWKNLFKKR